MNVIKKRKKISNKQESRVAKELGGTVMPSSGALDFSKSDVRVPGEYRIECKFTDSDSYILKLADLIKIRNEAVRKLEQPIFQIEFHSKNKAKYAIVPKQGDTPLLYNNFFEVPCMITYNKSIKLYSGDLFKMIGKSPLMVIAFDRIPHAKRMDFVIYEWNDFLSTLEKK